METGTARAPGFFLCSLAPVVLYTVPHLPLPPSQHQLLPRGCPRVLREHCSHTPQSPRIVCTAEHVCIVSDMGLGPNGTINGFKKKKFVHEPRPHDRLGYGGDVAAQNAPRLTFQV